MQFVKQKNFYILLAILLTTVALFDSLALALEILILMIFYWIRNCIKHTKVLWFMTFHIKIL